ncbi:MAG: thrombospondin type 3 repeat-containing protein [Kiritimatiellae bacterium]|nr:thrombospondin type 3 repeat-containing protein [Kiritimatiellia bacterium]
MKSPLRAFPPGGILAAALLATLVLVAPARAVQVRIASYNILNGLDTGSNGASSETTRNDDWWQVVDSIRRVDPDIVGFAELNNNDFAKLPELAALLGYPYYAISTEPMHTGSYRQGVMSKFPIVSSSLVKENTVDPDAAEIKRWPIHAVVQIPGALNPLHVFVVHTHPGTKEKANRLWRAMNAWRMRQYLSAMNAALPDDVEYVVMGDFNEDATGEIGRDQHLSFDYDYYADRLAASRLATSQGKPGAPFDSWFRLGSDFPWSTDRSFVLPYKTYPNERFNDLSPVASVRRTGFAATDATALATYPSTGYTLDYILFSSEIMQSPYGAPACEVYWGANDRENNPPGLSKPGPWLDTLSIGSDLTAAKTGLDHLMVFGDFNMIDAVPGITPVAIISEVAAVPNKVSANFVEIANTGASPLKVDGYTLELYSRDNTTPIATIPLSGSIPAGGVWWAAQRRDWASNYWASVLASNGLAWSAPNSTATAISKLDGCGAFVLKNASGIILDVYGRVGVDGEGQPWNYALRTASRLPGVTEPITSWNAGEWAISALSAATPGYHTSVSEADVAVASLALSPAAPAAGAPFALSATLVPNALASNLEVTAHFSLNGSPWSDGIPMAPLDGNVWSVDPAPLPFDPAPGDLLSYIVQVAFTGPGGLSPAFSSQHDYTFPGLSNGSGHLATALFNEVAPAAASPFIELAGAAGLDLAGWSVEHWSLADPDAPARLWSYSFPDGASLPASPAATDEWGNPVSFATLSAANFPAFSLNSAFPAALVLFDSEGRVRDAVAWLPADAPDAPFAVDFLPSAVLSTNVAQGLPNYLHVLGPLPASSALSLQAPDWILSGRATSALVHATQWSADAPTPAALNAAQSSGALALLRVDSDADALLDDEDNCRATPNPTQADIDGDGLGDACDPDMDGDSIPNGIDNCPYTPNPEQEDFDGDGIGDACDEDFDSDLVPPHEDFFVTFENVAADTSGSFSDGGREWRLANAAVRDTPADRKIGAHAARLGPGGTLTLDGFLANGLASVAFFHAPFDGASDTPPLFIETSTDGTTWTYLQSVVTSLSPDLSPVSFVSIGITNPVGIRFRFDEAAAPGMALDIDNIRIVSNVRATADVDLDSSLVVVYDGEVHTNSFSVFPAFANWTVSYTNAAGEVSDAPSAVGTWTAVLAVETTDSVVGGTFVFPGSLVIEQPVDPPAVTPAPADCSSTRATISGTVVPNRSAPLAVLFEYGTSTKFGNKIVADPSPVSGFEPVTVTATLSNLQPGTRYYWRIIAGDVISATRNFTTDPLPVPALSVAAATDTALQLAWDPVEGATNYILTVYTLAADGDSHVYDFADWTAHSKQGNWTNASPDGDWILSQCAVAPDSAALGAGSSGNVALSQNGSTLRSPAYTSIRAVRFTASASKSGSKLTLQVSTNGTTFARTTDWTIGTGASNCKWLTNAWDSPLPAGSVVRFRNDATSAIKLYDLVIDEATSTPANLPGYPRSLPPGTTGLLVSDLAPSTTYYLSILAQGPSWQTEASPTLAASTLAAGISPPVFARWPSTPAVTVGGTLSTNVSATGATNIFLAATTASGSASYDFSTGLFSYTPAPADIGLQTFAFVAQNPHGTVTNDFSVEVLPVPTPPAFIPWTSTPSVTVGNTLSTNVSATDASSIVLSATTASGSASFDKGLFTYIPASADVGTQTFTFVAQNSYAAVTNTYSVEVLPAPVSPVFVQWSSTPGVIVNSTLSTNVSASHASSIVLSSTTASGEASFDFATGLFAFTPADDDVGIQTFTFVAQNSYAAVTNTYSVEVLPIPVLPAFVPWPDTPSVIVGDTLSTNVTASDASAIVLSASTASGEAAFDDGLFSYTPAPADIGIQTFTFVAKNQHGAVTNDYSVEVLPIPVLPAFDPWPDTPTVIVGDTLSTNITASDASSIVLSATTATGEAAFDDGVFTYTPVPADVGNQSFTFIAQNQHVAVTNDYSVEVLPIPVLPTFVPWDSTPSVIVGDTLSTNVTASDASSIVLSATTASGEATYDDGLFSYTPVPTDVGTQTFTFVAQNQHGTVTNDFSVEVLPIPVLPAFDPWPDTPTVIVGDTLSTNVIATDATSIVLSATTASGEATFEDGLFSYTPAPADVGTQVFTFVAQNQHGAVTNDYSVEVLPIPVLPAFDPWPDTPAVIVGDTFSTNVSASDASSIVLSVSTASGEATFDDGLFTYTPAPVDVGTQSFTFVAQNPHGSVTNDYSVEVLPPPTPSDPYAEWLIARGLSPDDFPADADNDHDGTTNWAEFVADTAPDDPASVFAISFTSISPVSNIAVWTFPASTSRFYNLLASTNLFDFATNYLGRGVEDATFTNDLVPSLFLGIQALLEPPAGASD